MLNTDISAWFLETYISQGSDQKKKHNFLVTSVSGCDGNGVPADKRARAATQPSALAPVLKRNYLLLEKRSVEQLIYTVTTALAFALFRKRNSLKTLMSILLVAPPSYSIAMGSLHPPSGASPEHCGERCHPPLPGYCPCLWGSW